MNDDRGAALVMTLMAMALLSAVGAALVLATSADLAIAANAGAASESFYAADAVLERTVAELRTRTELTSILNGTAVSAFVDASDMGTRTLADGSTIVLSEILNQANCAKRTVCTDSDMNALFADRPWAGRNPRWRLFSHGPLDGWSGVGARGSPVYVVSMVADDPAETDGDPLRDGWRTGASVNPGAGTLLLRAEAFGRRRAHRIIEATFVRQDLLAHAVWDAADPLTRGPEPAGFPLVQLVAWREVR